MKKILIALILLSMIIIPSCSEKMTTEDMLKMNTKVVYSDDDTVMPQIFESYDEFEAVIIKSYEEEAIHPAALVKFEVTGYGDACLNFSKYDITDERCRNYIAPVFSGYKGVIKEIILKNAGNFPGETGKEIDILRAFFTVTDEKGKNTTYVRRPYSFPLIKGEEYYALVSIQEFEGKPYYCALYHTFMINDFEEHEELKPYLKQYLEMSYVLSDYDILRKGILEKYEGIKLD